MKKAYLMTVDENYFAEHIEFGKIDINKIVDYFKKKNIEIELLPVGSAKVINKEIVFTTSSQKPFQKQYIEDYLEFLNHNENIFIPSKNMIKAHENKGYQEYHKQLLSISSLKSLYLSISNIDYNQVKEIGYPLVLKRLDGSGSRGVKLIKNELALRKEIEKLKVSLHVRYLIYLKEKFKRLFLRKNNDTKLEYFKDYENYVIQEFIPNLKFDFKVLVFFDKYYVLKRNINKGDFRASGSGNFEFAEIENSLLDYSKSIFEKFNEPFISLDICFDGNKYYLIEYQGIHFGPYTQIYSQGFYKKIDEQWEFIEEKVSLEEDIAHSLYSKMQTTNN
jgi:glutathione synthase/RimK-type ligase-like ATP-grasp enzyme